MELRLTPADRKTLRKKISSSYLTGSIAGIMAAMVYLLINFTITNKFAINNLYVAITIITAIIFITSLAVRNLYSDLRRGIKICRYYPVTEKLSYPDSEPGIGGKYVKFCLYAGNRMFIVDEDMFQQAALNDLVEEHETPKSNVILHLGVMGKQK